MRERDQGSQALSLRVSTRDGVARLTVEGELDMASAPVLERAVDGLRLVAVPPPVLRVLEVTRTASLFGLDPVAG
jgi:hypothetical protein